MQATLSTAHMTRTASRTVSSTSASKRRQQTQDGLLEAQHREAQAQDQAGDAGPAPAPVTFHVRDAVGQPLDLDSGSSEFFTGGCKLRKHLAELDRVYFLHGRRSLTVRCGYRLA